jgi:uncharacterized iron-regulated protein
MSKILIKALTTLLLLLPSSVLAHDVITRMADGRNVTVLQMLQKAEASDIVLIGESHDNKAHHELQLSLIEALWQRKIPIAIGLEMFQSDSQVHLDEWTAGKMEEAAFQDVFAMNWSMDWDLYRDIFIFARNHHIPMIALNVPTRIIAKVARNGYGALTDIEKQDLPQGTSCDLNNPHTVFLKKTFEQVPNHMAASKMFTYFCEAQTLRNSAMALQIARYLNKHKGSKVVVLTGIWHAIKNAIPDQLERNGSKAPYTVILPHDPELTPATLTATDADYLISQ